MMAVVSEGSSLCPCVERYGRQKAGTFVYAVPGVSAWDALPRVRGCTSIKREQGGTEDRVAQHNSKGKFPDVQRRSRGSATLPRHPRRHADTPTRRYVFSPKSRFARN